MSNQVLLRTYILLNKLIQLVRAGSSRQGRANHWYCQVRGEESITYSGDRWILLLEYRLQAVPRLRPLLEQPLVRTPFINIPISASSRSKPQVDINGDIKSVLTFNLRKRSAFFPFLYSFFVWGFSYPSIFLKYQMDTRYVLCINHLHAKV